MNQGRQRAGPSYSAAGAAGSMMAAQRDWRRRNRLAKGLPLGDAPVAQLDRALPSEGRGHRFESCRVRQFFPCSVNPRRLPQRQPGAGRGCPAESSRSPHFCVRREWSNQAGPHPCSASAVIACALLDAHRRCHAARRSSAASTIRATGKAYIPSRAIRLPKLSANDSQICHIPVSCRRGPSQAAMWSNDVTTISAIKT